MGAVILILLAAMIIALIVVQIGGAIGALFFGRKLPWIWFALAALVAGHEGRAGGALPGD